MQIRIQSDRKTEATKIIQGKQGLFIPWQLENIEVQVYSNITYIFHILATVEAGVTDTFWTVDNIRRCFGDEIRVSSTQVASQDINSVTCESLQYPEWTFIVYRVTNNATECSYGYFGYNCQNKCGKCQGRTNRCDKISGKCSLVCEEGYTPPHCINTTGPVVLAPPTAVSVSHATVTLRLDNITTLGDSRADIFQI
ncbi:hypothetical protein CBL_10643 [Carabus blaptoides fortunei]